MEPRKSISIGTIARILPLLGLLLYPIGLGVYNGVEDYKTPYQDDVLIMRVSYHTGLDQGLVKTFDGEFVVRDAEIFYSLQQGHQYTVMIQPDFIGKNRIISIEKDHGNLEQKIKWARESGHNVFEE